ncbi:ABC transporter ATP-binding protein [Domibacillus aminovorans]|uniref:ABC transporter ATP-binding protein n=1 Tax=Domibacillus aminovorans TaxID=29332 RepID=UPI001E2C4CC9|nr:ABC transporter ATP-binding protein [Domibacillus aminovorans]
MISLSKIISYEHVRFLREERVILDDVNWIVNAGEHWAVLGLNGSGKSTMLNMMGGYEFPTSGTIHVFGHQYGKYNWEYIKKRLGFVGNTLNRFLSTLDQETAHEIIVSGKFNSIGIYEQTTDEDWKKAEQLLKEFHITYLANQPYRFLSQGEQRRVLIARAFMAQPDAMILDEPCSGLDVRAREDLLESLQEQALKNETVLLYVTHHIEEIIPAITHVAVIKDGIMIAAGPKKDVLTNDILSDAFGLPVEVESRGGRSWLQVVKKS